VSVSLFASPHGHIINTSYRVMNPEVMVPKQPTIRIGVVSLYTGIPRMESSAFLKHTILRWRKRMTTR
jgi:hypothetical protein